MRVHSSPRPCQSLDIPGFLQHVIVPGLKEALRDKLFAKMKLPALLVGWNVLTGFQPEALASGAGIKRSRQPGTSSVILRYATCCIQAPKAATALASGGVGPAMRYGGAPLSLLNIRR